MSDMTSAVAIDLIDNLIGMIEDNQENDYDAAFRMAIESLKAQAERTEERTETHSCDCISRQAAIDIVQGYAEQLQGYIGMPNDSEVYAYARGLLLSIDRNIKALPSAQPEPHWIPCSWRLPDSTEYVLVTDYGETNIGRRFCGRWWLDYCGDKMKDVTAWMPLPEPYREEGD